MTWEAVFQVGALIAWTGIWFVIVHGAVVDKRRRGK